MGFHTEFQGFEAPRGTWWREFVERGRKLAVLEDLGPPKNLHISLSRLHLGVLGRLTSARKQSCGYQEQGNYGERIVDTGVDRCAGNWAELRPVDT